MKKATSNEALFFVEDQLNRSQIPFFLLGETAKQAREGFSGGFEGDITLGLLKKDYTDSGSSILRMLMPHHTEWGDKKITVVYNGVNVEIKIIHRNYDFFKNTDIVIHSVSDFCLPNPFNKYWAARNLIQ
jgi:hypothetical protein